MTKITMPKHLEQVVKEALQEKQKTVPMLVERITDSAAAGNLISKTPADFYMVCRGQFSYVEVKFSAILDTLRSGFANLVKNHQLASARIANRAGGKYWIIFYSQPANRFELWNGMYCAEQRAKGKPLALGARVISSDKLEDVINYMTFAVKGVKDER